MRITKLERTKHTNRVMVFIDNEYSFTVGDNTVVKYALFKDKDLEPEIIEEIKVYDLSEICYLKVVEKIGLRPRSEKEVKDIVLDILKKPRFKDTTYNGELIFNKVLARLKQNKLIDDGEFARWLIESRVRQKKKSKLELIVELNKFDIGKNTYEPILNELFDSSVQEELVTKLATKKLLSLPKNKYSQKERQTKTMQYLARKGFSFDIANKIIKNLINY